MKRDDIIVFVVIAIISVFGLIAFVGMSNRIAECEKSGGVLVRLIYGYQCIKVAR